MDAVLIILSAVILLLILACILGLLFVRMLIKRQDGFPTPETGAGSSALLEPTGKALWAYNIPKFAAFRGLPFESAELYSRDGLLLHADVLPGAADAGVTVICAHGYKSLPVYDFSAISEMYRAMGVNLIFPHMRAHEKSEGKYIGFGALDRYDLLLWSRRAAELFPRTSIFLHGMSMGAAAALQSAELDLPEQVCGIIADCGFSSCDEVFRNLIGGMYHLPATPFVDIFEFVNRFVAGYGFSDGDSVRSMKNSKKPLLYICGDRDRYVPYDMAMRIYDACTQEKRLLIVPGAGHAACYMCATAEYTRLTSEFINKYKREVN